MQHHMLGEPQPVKILGIFHVLLAVYGFGATALGIITTFVGNPIYKFMPMTPELAKQMALEEQMKERMMVSTVITLAITVATASICFVYFSVTSRIFSL